MHVLSGYKRSLYRRLWLQWPVWASGYVTAISHATRQELALFAECNPDRIRVIGCPIPDGFTRVPPNDWSAEPVILQVGTDPNKNLERVARALAGIHCRLVIVGQCDPRVEEALRGARVAWVNRAGVTDAEMPSIYASADVVLFASTYEGFGLPIIEAQATGRPVVTSRVTAMPEVAGEGACLVDPYDTESIRDGVLRVIRDEGYRNALVRRGLENVRRFEPREIAAQYARLYEEILRSAGPRDDGT
jgi:glycosyltransferase involved in cell wall biosynthesis